MNALRIVYEEDGYPRELSGESEIRVAILSGALAPDSYVTVYRAGQSPRYGPARDVQELGDIFAPASASTATIVAGSPGVLPSELRSPEHGQLETASKEASACAERGEEFDQVSGEGSDRSELAPTYSPSERWDGRPKLSWRITWFAAVALLLVVAAGALFRSAESSTAGSAPTTYVVIKKANLRAGPATDQPTVGKLSPGDTFKGKPAQDDGADADWIEVTDGNFTGRFVWAKNVRMAALETRPLIQSTTPSPAAAPHYLPDCSGISCRVMTADGWAGIHPGMPIGPTMKVAGLQLRTAGAYDEAGSDESGEVTSCNEYQVVGAPNNLWVFVEDGRVTSVRAALDDPHSTRFTTERGVSLGDTEADVRRAYSKLDQKPDIYSELPDKKLFFHMADGNGIKFSIGRGKVTEIAAGGGSIQYVEGCL